MWQLYALASIFFASCESVVDKVAIVSDRRIDSLIATTWRLLMFFAGTLIIGASGYLGGIAFIFTPPVFLVAIIGTFNSLFYTYLLRKIEITGIGAMAYLAPFLFLLIDTNILHTHFSAGEVAGIVLMVLGGFGFAIDGKTHHFKKELSLRVWFIFLYMIAYTGIESYVFKYLHTTNGTTPVAFTLSYGVIMCVGLLALVVVRGKWHLMWQRASRVYVPQVAISKGFDAMSSVLWVQALTVAAVSQVTAMNALEPLMLFALTILIQDVFRFSANERLGKGRLKWKAAAISMMVLGGLLVS